MGILIVAVGLAAVNAPAWAQAPTGTLEDPIIDSAMTEAEAFEGLRPGCPAEVRDAQRLFDVVYQGFDGKVHKGQIVAHKDLVEDIRHAFAVALKEKFPIRSAIPVSHPKFRKNGFWDDDLSMEADNTSSFNYRPITGGTRISNHGYGRAIDVNTAENPYIKGSKILPPGAKYDPRAPGTLTRDHPFTRAFVDRGWTWAGDWKAPSPTDYQHFEKPDRK
ncbi:M15 family metallopeptidase [Paludisphaera mucosa]|uniref:M15 family metallopeptidase n=1 Tax=Paludisphaera mucosa TaxID=3030827 RepID=A0ABT6FEU2_9BACT|nr:M15 family metallopeptidase [Paludisphaera mucosa]MDG3006098.1 M15 family metallopeptidase [Paludisphaera mucosa]